MTTSERDSGTGRPPSVSSDAYRSTMRHWPSGVTVITMPMEPATGTGGEPPSSAHGMTASAFTSVSIDPPLVLIVIDQRWRSHDMIADAGVFCVNVLGDDQQVVSDRFAGRHGEMDDRFADLPTVRAVTGAPVLSDALSWLDCEVDATHVAGDHSIFVGRVVATGINRPNGMPLLYHDGAYRHLAPTEPPKAERRPAEDPPDPEEMARDA